MSIEQTPPNLENDGIESDVERVSADFDRIHALCEILSPAFPQIEEGVPIEDEALRDKFTELTVLLNELHPADVAAVLESLPPRERNIVWLLVTPEDDGEVLLEVSDAVRETLIESMDKDELLAAVDDLDADELAELAGDLPHQVVYEALQTRDEEERAQVKAAMSYEDNQVGAIMDFELVSIRADVTCEVVLRYLRRFESLPDHTDKIFVVDENDILQGVLPIRKLLVADPEDLVADVMATEVVRFRPEDDVEEAAQAFERYDLVTAPVVDENKKLIGRITIDEMVDVIREESEADMLNMAGLQEEPIVAGIGGNSGNQTITMIVRAMAMGQLTGMQAGRLLKKEVGVALVNGIIWGTVMGVVSWLLYGSIGIGLVMVAAMTLNLLLAASVGVLIPVIMEKFGRDPALGSSVLITAVTDSGGFLIFLGLATMFLL